jgi:hypothetical protein
MNSELESHWLSYAELAAQRGIAVASAIRVARRRRWPKQQANDGTVRVSVPVDFLNAPRVREEVTEDIPPDISPDVLADIRAQLIALEPRLATQAEDHAALIVAKDNLIGMLQLTLADLRAEREAGRGREAALLAELAARRSFWADIRTRMAAFSAGLEDKARVMMKAAGKAS